MKKVLFGYFSIIGIIKDIVCKISDFLSYDLFEIEPIIKYTNKALDWTYKNSRSSLELNNTNSKYWNNFVNIDLYDKVINTYIFVTIASSGIESSFAYLKENFSLIKYLSDKKYDYLEKDKIIKKWLRV